MCHRQFIEEEKPKTGTEMGHIAIDTSELKEVIRTL